MRKDLFSYKVLFIKVIKIQIFYYINLGICLHVYSLKMAMTIEPYYGKEDNKSNLTKLLNESFITKGSELKHIEYIFVRCKERFFTLV